MRLRSLLLALALLPLVFAANDPGHDTLYIESTGDSLLTGELNISDDLRVANLFYSSYLDILGNNSQPSGSFAQIYTTSSGNELVLNAPQTITLAKDSGSIVHIGGSDVDLNVTGEIYERNVRVCLANGTNCLSGNNSGNVSSVTAGNGISVSPTTGDVVVSASAATCSGTEYSYWDGDSWECRTDQGSGGSVWSTGSGTIYNTTASVGIGTNSPGGLLHLVGATQPSLVVNDTTNDVQGVFRADDASAAAGTSTNHDFVLLANNNVIVTLDSSGTVGINTSVPGALLDVNGTLLVQSVANPGITIGDGSIGYLQVGNSVVYDNAGDLTLDSDSGEVYIPDELGVNVADPTAQFEVSGSANFTDANVSIESTFSLCFNTACTARVYHNGSALIVEGQ